MKRTTKRCIDWEPLKPLIERLVRIEHLDDESMAARFGLTPGAMAKVRHKLGILMPSAKGSRKNPPPPPPSAIRTFTYREGGRTITVYPSGRAEGSVAGSYTAMPRGKV